MGGRDSFFATLGVNALPGKEKALKTHEERENSRIQALASISDELSTRDVEGCAPGGIAYHQALHTSWICLDMVDRHLLENEAVLLDPELHKLADQAHDILFDLYQLFGEKLSRTNARLENL